MLLFISSHYYLRCSSFCNILLCSQFAFPPHHYSQSFLFSNPSFLQYSSFCSLRFPIHHFIQFLSSILHVSLPYLLIASYFFHFFNLSFPNILFVLFVFPQFFPSFSFSSSNPCLLITAYFLISNLFFPQYSSFCSFLFPQFVPSFSFSLLFCTSPLSYLLSSTQSFHLPLFLLPYSLML